MEELGGRPPKRSKLAHDEGEAFIQLHSFPDPISITKIVAWKFSYTDFPPHQVVENMTVVWLLLRKAGYMQNVDAGRFWP